jgi:hypothetical protein
MSATRDSRSCRLSDAPAASVDGVPPGEYVLKHAGRIRRSPSAGQPAFWLSQHLTVGSVMSGTSPCRFARRCASKPDEFRAPEPFRRSSQRRRDLETAFGESGQFAFKARTEIRARSSRSRRRAIHCAADRVGRLVLKSVTVDDKDVTDKVFDLQADRSSSSCTPISTRRCRARSRTRAAP